MGSFLPMVVSLPSSHGKYAVRGNLFCSLILELIKIFDQTILFSSSSVVLLLVKTPSDSPVEKETCRDLPQCFLM